MGDSGKPTPRVIFLAAELDGLATTTSTVRLEAEPEDELDAFTINGETYRSAGRPSWADGSKSVGSIHPGFGGAGGDGAAHPPWAGTGQGKPCG